MVFIIFLFALVLYNGHEKDNNDDNNNNDNYLGK